MRETNLKIHTRQSHFSLHIRQDSSSQLNIDHQQKRSKKNHHAHIPREYDARLLLSPPPSSTTLSNLDPQITSPPGQSPTGYSDLPSDHEEMFYFEPQERLEIAQNLRRKLRRRRDDERTTRIKLREEEDRLHEEQLRLSKVSQINIPPAEQIALMKRTLDALKASPSPSLLEIRILTNHGHDPRFSSFLRREGKWSAYWESMKKAPDPRPNSASIPSGTLPPRSAIPPNHPAPVAGGLVDYDDSSEENESNDGTATATDFVPEEHPTPTPLKGSTDTSAEADEGLPDATMMARGGESSPTNEDKAAGPCRSMLKTEILEFDPEMICSATESTQQPVDSVERFNRQQRAKQWADKRKKTNPSVPPDPPPPPPRAPSS
ncbi:hypothetical protein VP01_3702g2 [Puccinia sorghi]|uniref:SURP motif domain-containing protein n=1 Tax=Puccinia sorghi TaxID=27349 RepID=A0A0L6UU47_9BASI|nr:hypothetical protein VP01_3702g2 [Puccinia sorghi]